ncbi:hypothetical protein DFJ74DRAFT_230006 [Hyaloraphidium curvatum]|nr:hypothetical protein DFJ74DRAFT_230006 [Hyaloraphidium curvatum]
MLSPQRCCRRALRSRAPAAGRLLRGNVRWTRTRTCRELLRWTWTRMSPTRMALVVGIQASRSQPSRHQPSLPVLPRHPAPSARSPNAVGTRSAPGTGPLGASSAAPQPPHAQRTFADIVEHGTANAPTRLSRTERHESELRRKKQRTLDSLDDRLARCVNDIAPYVERRLRERDAVEVSRAMVAAALQSADTTDDELVRVLQAHIHVLDDVRQVEPLPAVALGFLAIPGLVRTLCRMVVDPHTFDFERMPVVVGKLKDGAPFGDGAGTEAPPAFPRAGRPWPGMDSDAFAKQITQQEPEIASLAELWDFELVDRSQAPVRSDSSAPQFKGYLRTRTVAAEQHMKEMQRYASRYVADAPWAVCSFKDAEAVAAAAGDGIHAPFTTTYAGVVYKSDKSPADRLVEAAAKDGSCRYTNLVVCQAVPPGTESGAAQAEAADAAGDDVADDGERGSDEEDLEPGEDFDGQGDLEEDEGGMDIDALAAAAGWVANAFFVLELWADPSTQADFFLKHSIFSFLERLSVAVGGYQSANSDVGGFLPAWRLRPEVAEVGRRLQDARQEAPLATDPQPGPDHPMVRALDDLFGDSGAGFYAAFGSLGSKVPRPTVDIYRRQLTEPIATVHGIQVGMVAAKDVTARAQANAGSFYSPFEGRGPRITSAALLRGLRRQADGASVAERLLCLYQSLKKLLPPFVDLILITILCRRKDKLYLAFRFFARVLKILRPLALLSVSSLTTTVLVNGCFGQDLDALNDSEASLECQKRRFAAAGERIELAGSLLVCRIGHGQGELTVTVPVGHGGALSHDPTFGPILYNLNELIVEEFQELTYFLHECLLLPESPFPELLKAPDSRYKALLHLRDCFADAALDDGLCRLLQGIKAEAIDAFHCIRGARMCSASARKAGRRADVAALFALAAGDARSATCYVTSGESVAVVASQPVAAVSRRPLDLNRLLHFQPDRYLSSCDVAAVATLPPLPPGQKLVQPLTAQGPRNSPERDLQVLVLRHLAATSELHLARQNGNSSPMAWLVRPKAALDPWSLGPATHVDPFSVDFAEFIKGVTPGAAFAKAVGGWKWDSRPSDGVGDRTASSFERTLAVGMTAKRVAGNPAWVSNFVWDSLIAMTAPTYPNAKVPDALQYRWCACPACLLCFLDNRDGGAHLAKDCSAGGHNGAGNRDFPKHYCVFPHDLPELEQLTIPEAYRDRLRMLAVTDIFPNGSPAFAGLSAEFQTLVRTYGSLRILARTVESVGNAAERRKENQAYLERAARDRLLKAYLYLGRPSEVLQQPEALRRSGPCPIASTLRTPGQLANPLWPLANSEWRGTKRMKSLCYRLGTGVGIGLYTCDVSGCTDLTKKYVSGYRLDSQFQPYCNKGHRKTTIRTSQRIPNFWMLEPIVRIELMRIWANPADPLHADLGVNPEGDEAWDVDVDE